MVQFEKQPPSPFPVLDDLAARKLRSTLNLKPKTKIRSTREEIIGNQQTKTKLGAAQYFGVETKLIVQRDLFRG